MANDEWLATGQGSTIGQEGPQGGVIALDQTGPAEARLIYETVAETGLHAVTVSIPDWLLHPRFFPTREAALAAMDAMREPVAELARSLPQRRPAPGSTELFDAGARLAEWMTRFP